MSRAGLRGHRRAAASPELMRLSEQLWSPGASGLLVTGDEPPPGHRVVEQFFALPSLARARILLPVAPARTVARALTEHNALRSPSTRLLRRALATSVRVGGGRAVLTQRLLVCAPRSMSEDDLDERLLLRHLRKRLATPGLLVAVGVGNPGPNRKPTLQAFTPGGAPLAYVKVGWNDLTRDMVDNEARALTTLARRGAAAPCRPGVLFHEGWRGLSLLATQPLPPGAHRRSGGPPPSAASIRAAGPSDRGPLRESRWWSSTVERLAELSQDDCLPAQERSLVERYADRWLGSRGGEVVTTAAWHGDWTPWNMAHSGGQLWAWDWEHFGEHALAGLDEANYAFQRTFIHQRRSIADALAAAAAAATSADVPTGTVPGDLVMRAYLLELYLRGARMHRLGAGWNERFHAETLEHLR